MDQDIFHLFSGLDIPAGIGLSEAFEVMFVVSAHNDRTEGEGLQEVSRGFWRQLSGIAALSLGADALDEGGGIFKGCGDWRRG